MRLLEERRGLQRVEVDLGDGPERAYTLTQLTGPVAVGDRVVVNTTAVELGLGTGGWHVVHWNLARDEWRKPGPGHVLAFTDRRTLFLLTADSFGGDPLVEPAYRPLVPF